MLGLGGGKCVVRSNDPNFPYFCNFKYTKINQLIVLKDHFNWMALCQFCLSCLSLYQLKPRLKLSQVLNWYDNSCLFVLRSITVFQHLCAETSKLLCFITAIIWKYSTCDALKIHQDSFDQVKVGPTPFFFHQNVYSFCI